jgi:GntR family transcriptional regulator
MNAPLHLEHRWPFQPLLEVSGVPTETLRRRLGLDTSTIATAVTDGLTDLQADHWAVRLGWHPMSVWGWAWIDHADQAAQGRGRIAAVLRGQIERGDFTAGEQLPSAKELAKRFEASSTTVSRALTELRAEGLVTGGGRGLRCIVANRDPEVQAS